MPRSSGHRPLIWQCPVYPESGHGSTRLGCPRVDGSELARLFFTFAGWSVRPCVRPVSAAHEAAGHNALRGSGPGQKRAFKMHWHMWVVLIAGSAGSALRAVRPPNLHVTPGSRRDLIHAASATGSL